MTRRFPLRAVSLLIAVLASAWPAIARQQSVTHNDIQRLQDQVYQASTDLSRVRTTDSNLAARLETELDEVRDEVTYLKVKLRKEGSVSRTEYSDVRDKLQDIRSRARGDAARGGSTPAAPSGVSGGVTGGAAGGATGGVSGGVSEDSRRPSSRSSAQTTIPVGQEIDVRLERQLTSDTAQVEDRFEATTVANLMTDSNAVLIPAGSVMRGVVSSVNRASRTDRKGSLTVAFDQITINGRAYPMRGTVTQALESEGIRGEVGRIGAGAGVGAIIGGIIGGVKGALLGVLIGGGGTMVATEGKDVTLPPGTILRVRLDQPPSVR